MIKKIGKRVKLARPKLADPDAQLQGDGMAVKMNNHYVISCKWEKAGLEWTQLVGIQINN